MRKLVILLVALLITWLAGIGGQKGEAVMSFTLGSNDFIEGGEIPELHTCEGGDISPHLGWSDPPDGTASFALIVDDPDAPDPQAPRMVWVHWVLYNLPPSESRLPQGASSEDLPNNTFQGVNDWKRMGYGGPCPPIGRHRYFHRLYALDTVLPDLGAATRKELEAAMEGHVLGVAELMGTYQKRR